VGEALEALFDTPPDVRGGGALAFVADVHPIAPAGFVTRRHLRLDALGGEAAPAFLRRALVFVEAQGDGAAVVAVADQVEVLDALAPQFAHRGLGAGHGLGREEDPVAAAYGHLLRLHLPARPQVPRQTGA